MDGVLLQFDVSKCIPYDSFMFPIKCSIVLYYVPNLFLKFPIAAFDYPMSTFAQIPNYIGNPKKILHYVYFRSGKNLLTTLTSLGHV